jgi:hypothetical protein
VFVFALSWPSSIHLSSCPPQECHSTKTQRRQASSKCQPAQPASPASQPACQDGSRPTSRPRGERSRLGQRTIELVTKWFFLCLGLTPPCYGEGAPQKIHLYCFVSFFKRPRVIKSTREGGWIAFGSFPHFGIANPPPFVFPLPFPSFPFCDAPRVCV